MARKYALLGLALMLPAQWCSATVLQVSAAPSAKSGSIELVGGHGVAPIWIDDADYRVVHLAADLLAGDVSRVTGRHPLVGRKNAHDVIVAGTLGHSPLIARLAAAGKLHNLDAIRGKWEATLTQVVDNPLPGVKRALVIVGSDRRGTAYGLTQLSEKIGVSPWNWWADVPVAHRASLYISSTAPSVDKPAVKYRGIFINDEDWGISRWASNVFDPQRGNIGPKTYAKVFDLMLRLRLNYIWPAMHGVTTEFGSIPENAALADEYGVVVGSSHCEPMLYNNVHWDEAKQGKWDYSLNQDVIRSVWEKTAKERATYEAVWTTGIRGIHDRPMEGPDDIPTRIATVSRVIADQRALLDRYVTKAWGPPAQIFVPYKEVLPIYDGGLAVPSDITLVWVDDNFGYLRRLSSPAERKRAGGAGVYWHLSYYGSPHSYTWINTTAPALMWEELEKAWNNDARKVWVINVGDIKPMEIGIDYFARLAWNPEQMGTASQPRFLSDFAARNFGPGVASEMSAFLGEFYRLGTIRKPELMNREWALSLTPERAAALRQAYHALLAREARLAAVVAPEARDAYVETIGFPARVLGMSGLIFMADRDIQSGINPAANAREINALRQRLSDEVERYNTQLAGGKWKEMMPGLETAHDLTSWASQVRWPWGEKAAPASGQTAAGSAPPAEANWRDAASFDRQSGGGGASWVSIAGLGTSARGMMVRTASGASADRAIHGHPALEYRFINRAGADRAYVDFLPSFRLYPGQKLTVEIGIDGQPPTTYEVPGSGGSEDENGRIRAAAVQDNYVRLSVPLSALSRGDHIFRIATTDPGVVVDRVWLPR